jgi:hypothetical protein
MDGTYSTAEFFIQEYDWEDLVPGFKHNQDPTSQQEQDGR